MGKYRVARQPTEADALLESYPGVERATNRPIVAKRFTREWSAAARASGAKLAAHARALQGQPGMLEMLDVGTSGDAVWIVREHADGSSLRQTLTALARQGQGLASAELVAIVRATGETLAQVQAADATRVHGGLAASTVWLTEPGAVLLDDFGVAALIGAAGPGGPPRSELAAIAPEQLDGKATPATDIFQLGLVLFELATGRPLFAGANAVEVVAACRRYHGLPSDAVASLGAWWGALLRGMLAPEPAARPPASHVQMVLSAAAEKSGWSASAASVAALVERTRAAPSPTGPGTSVDLDLTPFGTASSPSGIVPMGGAVLARVSTAKISREVLEARRAADTPPAPVKTLAERIRDGLVEAHVVTAEQLAQADDYMTDFGGTIEEALLGIHACGEDALVEAIAAITKTTATTREKLSRMPIPHDAVAVVPVALATELELVPLALKGAGQLVVAMRDPLDTAKLEKLKSHTGFQSVLALRAGPEALEATRGRFYGASEEDWLVSQEAMDLNAEFTEVAHQEPVTRRSGILAAPTPVPSRESGLRVAPPPRTESAGGPPGDPARLTLRTPAGHLVRHLIPAPARSLLSVASGVARRLGAPEPQRDRLEFALAAIIAINVAAGREVSDLPMDPEFREALGNDAWNAVEPLVDAWLRWPESSPHEPAPLALCLTLGLASNGGVPLPRGTALKERLAAFRSTVFIADDAFQALAAEASA